MKNLSYGLIVAAVMVGLFMLAFCVIYFGWNMLVVPAFGVRSITFWQAVVMWFVLAVVGSFFRSNNSK